MVKSMDENLFLIGMMGAGKSTVGALLAKKLCWGFMDLDSWIEKRHGPISEIFQTKGQRIFRHMETCALRSAVQKKKTVIATGGGIVESPSNREYLSILGRCVYLQGSIGTLLDHLEGNTEKRPLLQTETPAKTLENIFEKRRYLYETTAHITVCIDGKTPDEIVAEIQERYLEN